MTPGIPSAAAGGGLKGNRKGKESTINNKFDDNEMTVAPGWNRIESNRIEPNQIFVETNLEM